MLGLDDWLIGGWRDLGSGATRISWYQGVLVVITSLEAMLPLKERRRIVYGIEQCFFYYLDAPN